MLHCLDCHDAEDTYHYFAYYGLSAPLFGATARDRRLSRERMIMSRVLVTAHSLPRGGNPHQFCAYCRLFAPLSDATAREVVTA